MEGKETQIRQQRSNSEELEFNAKLFCIVRKRNISTQEKMKKIKKLLGKKPQPDINAQDGNDNWNTALHLAIERNELKVVNFLISQGADTIIENGDGKTPLQLAKECNNVEIIDAFKSCTSSFEWPQSEADRLASHTSQPVAANPNDVSLFHSNSHATVTDKQTPSTVLLPFAGKLRVDKHLLLSHINFKQSLQEFYASKQLSAIDQLKATPPYPTTHMLAQFASMAYSDCKHGDPEPPAGWQLLTAASNFGVNNGYFGTAYWHPEHQQVVIAHRGTDINYIGALLTDIKGVLFNNYVEQMSSASTFANKVVAVLQEIEQQNMVSFELFFTGHSLGGWLAQITAFTTEYLEVKRATFLKKQKMKQDEPLASSTEQDKHDFRNVCHPHTIVFDSPGCETMLLEMKKSFDVRLKGRSIDLEHLDITSYLSAPNRINTCNSHVGTVYRIFTDMSDMGWMEKHTALYNLATHRMDKIMDVFDPETGQVYKDDRGRLKVLEVVDWPLSGGLTGGLELNVFFEWAQHLNNYHPEVMDTVHSIVPKGFHPVRYQTKAHDECTKSLSIFAQDEREFLERYCWLRDMGQLFKLKDLFSVMNNHEAQTQTEKWLQNFKLDNESINCPDASTLHTLIPFVKRLVRLFPNIKTNIEKQMSSPHISSMVYQNETEHYVSKIHNSPLDFNPGALGVKEFLTSDQQVWHLQMNNGDAWPGITKVYQVLKKTSCTFNYISEGQYTILKLKRLLTVNRMINLNELLESIETSHLLMLACENNQPVNDELENMFNDLFSILKRKKNLKIILTSQSDDSISEFIQQLAMETIDDLFITTNEQLTWSDLTDISQTEILKKAVIFQGRSVALNQLISAKSMTDTFPLAELLQEKVLRIGEEPVTSSGSGYNEKFYMDRSFNRSVVIRQGILNDKKRGNFAYLLASNEQEFKEFCQQNPDGNVHWLEEAKAGELVWRQSQGNLKSLRKYIDEHKADSYTPRDLEKLFDQAKLQRVMLIAEKAGMGKTTLLTHLSKRMKENYPSHWLVRIDLNDYTGLFEAMQEEGFDKGRVLEFVSNNVLMVKSHLEEYLIKKCFEGNETSKVVVMVDGFDEISPNYKEKVMGMLKVLKQTPLEQLWVTTRPHLSDYLEDNLQQLSYTLQPFSEVEQVEFLKKFWLQTSNIAVTNEDRLQMFAEALIRKWAQSISDEYREFTGIPLQTRMLAEAFEEDFISFYSSQKSEPELPQKLDLLGLYARFIERKYNIYYREKCKTAAGNVGANEQRDNYLKTVQRQHQRLALEVLFSKDWLKLMQNDQLYTLSDEELARIGIAQGNREGYLQFIHRTFAEYFVAEFLIKHLTETEQNTQVQDFLLIDILLGTDHQIIRAFLDGLLEKNPQSEQALKDFGEKLYEHWHERKEHKHTTPLHQAAAEDNVNIIEFIFNSLNSAGHLETVKRMVFAKDENERNALYRASEERSLQATNKISDWIESGFQLHI